MKDSIYYQRKANYFFEMLLQVRNREDWIRLRTQYEKAYRLYHLESSRERMSTKLDI